MLEWKVIFARLLEEGFVQEAGVEKHRVEQVRKMKRS